MLGRIRVGPGARQASLIKQTVASGHVDGIGRWKRRSLIGGDALRGVGCHRQRRRYVRRNAESRQDVRRGRGRQAAACRERWKHQFPTPSNVVKAFVQRIPFKRDHWYYYQLYTLERYESFLRLRSRDRAVRDPKWYDEGVKQLQKVAGSLREMVEPEQRRQAQRLPPRSPFCF